MEKDKDLGRKVEVIERNPLKGRKKKYLIPVAWSQFHSGKQQQQLLWENRLRLRTQEQGYSY